MPAPMHDPVFDRVWVAEEDHVTGFLGQRTPGLSGRRAFDDLELAATRGAPIRCSPSFGEFVQASKPRRTEPVAWLTAVDVGAEWRGGSRAPRSLHAGRSGRGGSPADRRVGQFAIRGRPKPA